MRLIESSTQRPVSVFIFAVAAVVFGAVALGRLSTDLLPDMSYPSLTVRTEHQDAAPIEVESLITRPVENAVGVVNGVVRVTSSSRADVSEVTLELDWGTNMDLAGLDVRERLDVLRLPTEAERPVLLRYDPSLDPILRLGLYRIAGDRRAGTGPTPDETAGDLIQLRRLAEDEVQRALQRVEGVAAAVVSGGLEEEIQVELDERQLANLGLSVDLVRGRLAQENVNLTGGRLVEGQTEYLVRTVNEILRAEDLRPLVVARVGDADVRLEDVARIYRGYREREIVTRIDGRESVEVAVYKEGGTNTVTVSDAVTASLDELRRSLEKIDPGLRIQVVTDQAEFIRQSVDQVLDAALWGGVLAILVLYFFLRGWQTTLTIGVAIPISVMATFFLMYAFGISLNIMSLGGLTLGIGLLVDNAIVVLEAIQRRRDQGLADLEAVHTGAGEVDRAVIASTLTTICVFVPIVFVEGVAGQLFGDQALTVTFALAVSLVVALTVIPMMASRTFRGAGEEDAGEKDDGQEDPGEPSSGALSRALFALAVRLARAIRFLVAGLGRLVDLPLLPFLWAFERTYRALERSYARLLDGALRRPLLVACVALALFVVSLSLYRGLGQELVPEMVQGEIFVDVELEPGTHLDVTQRRLARLADFALGLDHVATAYAVAGTSNEQGGVAGELRENLGQITLVLEPPVSRAREEALMDRLREVLDHEESLTYRFGRPAYFSFSTPIEVEIRGYSLTLLKSLADDVAARMEKIAGLADVKSSTRGGSPELRIRFRRDRLAALGLDLSAVADVVRSKVQGAVATDIPRDDRRIDIRVRSAEGYRDSVEDLRQLAIEQRGKTSIPLSAVAEIDEVEGPAEIRRAEGDRVALITANLDGRDLASVSDDIEAILASTRWPHGFDWRVGGQRREMETSFQSLELAISLAIFMVYLVMASQFESLLHPLVILFSVPFSVIGVLATLRLLDLSVSIVVLIGVILLAGIVVNNAIILVDTTNRLRAEGLAKLDALRQAGSLRLRPILMTTATTVLGLTPMALGLGEGAELRTPMALTVIGGLVTSTVLTLLVLPAVYTLVDRRGQ